MCHTAVDGMDEVDIHLRVWCVVQSGVKQLSRHPDAQDVLGVSSGVRLPVGVHLKAHDSKSLNNDNMHQAWAKQPQRCAK